MEGVLPLLFGEFQALWLVSAQAALSPPHNILISHLENLGNSNVFLYVGQNIWLSHGSQDQARAVRRERQALSPAQPFAGLGIFFSICY